MNHILPAGVILQNRYRIVRLPGQGGMGAVYLAHDQRLDKPCALKETLDVSPQAQRSGCPGGLWHRQRVPTRSIYRDRSAGHFTRLCPGRQTP